MSVKIYEAYRAPADADLWPLLWSIKKRGQAEARALLAQAYRDILDGRAQALIDWYDRYDAALREQHGQTRGRSCARCWTARHP